MVKDLIIGAGITGLSYANFCDHKDYLIIEKDAQVGGYCKTIKQDGFIWDYSGHFFHFRNKEIRDFLFERMPLGEVLTLVKRTQIKYKNSYIDFPFQKNIHQLRKNEFIDCLYDLFNIEENLTYNSFKDMLYGKFGKSISNKFLIPYNEKLYACDLEVLDVNAMGRFFPYVEREEIIRNFKLKDNNFYNQTFTYPANGSMEYVYALLSDLAQNKICLNEELTRIDVHNKIAYTNKREIQYNRLISTISLPALLNHCDVKYAKNIYTWNKVLVFNLGFDKVGEDKKNHWVYFPEKKYCFYRVGYYNNIITHPRMSLYIEIGFEKDAEINIQEFKDRTIVDLKHAGIITSQNIISSHYVVLDPAYVHIKKESEVHKASVKALLSKSDVYTIGRYGDWKYCSIEDNIIESKILADKLNEKY